MKNKKHFDDTLNRDDFWMGMAFNISAGSKHRRQGAVIVTTAGELVTMAYDGLPRSLSEDHTIHAELKSILQAKSSLFGCTLYVTHPPCYHCSAAVVGAEIRRLVYFPMKLLDPQAADILRVGLVQAEEYRGNLNWMRDYLMSLEIFQHI